MVVPDLRPPGRPERELSAEAPFFRNTADDPRRELPSPLEPFRSAFAARRLLVPLVRREVQERYRDSGIGAAWWIGQPLVLLAIYTFVFSEILGARWATDGGTGEAPFALLLFAGLIPFQVLGESLSRAPNQLREYATLVKKVVFPIEILAWVQVSVALFGAAISFAVLCLFQFLLAGPPPLSALLLPVLVAPLALSLVGSSWLLAAAGTYVRDTQQVVQLGVTASLFLSPVFYPLSSVPASVRPLFLLNPLTPTIEALRGALFRGELPSWPAAALSWGGALLLLWIGFVLFGRARRGFADVL